MVGVLLAGLAIFPPSPPAVTISGVSFTILQGSSSNGTPWFGSTTLNLSGPANGFPIQTGSGGSFTLALILLNHDPANHTVYSIALDSPLSVTSTSPALPVIVGAGEDGLLVVFVQVNAGSGATVFGTGSINTLS